ncbi:MAG: hypothetical protein M3461_01985 [Pseudomonadota bacterium]|nr:hypothetical protein [Pseudomonadota bacterium]
MLLSLQAPKNALVVMDRGIATEKNIAEAELAEIAAEIRDPSYRVNVSGPSSVRGASFGVFWRLGRARAKGDCRLRAEPDGRGYRFGIRLYWSRSNSRRGSGRCSGGQAEMGEDLGDHGGVLDGGDDLKGAAPRARAAPYAIPV